MVKSNSDSYDKFYLAVKGLKRPRRTCFSQPIVCHCIRGRTSLQRIFEMWTLHDPMSTVWRHLAIPRMLCVWRHSSVVISRSGVIGKFPAYWRLDVTCGRRALNLRPVTNDNRRHSRFDGQTVQWSTSNRLPTPARQPVCTTVTYLRQGSNIQPKWH